MIPSVSLMRFATSINHIVQGTLIKPHFSGKLSKILSVNYLAIGRNKGKRVTVLNCMSAFFHAVSNIVFLCSKPQMLWVDAQGIVARMTNDKTVVEFPIMQFIRKSVRVSLLAAFCSTLGKRAVFTVSSPNPKPATGTSSYSSPKFINAFLHEVLHNPKGVMCQAPMGGCHSY